MTDDRDGVYPVPRRTPLANRHIATHEAGHALVIRFLGNCVHKVTIIRGPHFEGRCIRSGPSTELTFGANQTQEIVSTCERLAAIAPEAGARRLADAEYIVIGQNAIIELLAGTVAEEIVFGDTFAAEHDAVEAAAFARVSVASEPAIKSLLEYCRQESRSICLANRDVLDAISEALVERGKLSGAEIDLIIDRAIVLRSIEIEHQRRADWRQRELNAADFLEEFDREGSSNYTQ